MIYYLTCFILSALLTAVHIYKWRNQYGIHFSLMYVFATISNFGYWQIHDSTELNQVILANKIAYVGGCFSTLALLICIFTVCKVNLNGWFKILLWTITCFVYGTCLTVGYSDIFYKNVALELVDGKYKFIKEYAFFHTVFYVMLISYVLISLVVLIVGLRKKKDVSVKSVVLMFIVMMTNFLSFFLGRALLDIELITASFVITEIVVLIITNRLMLYNVDEIAAMSMISQGETGAAVFDFDYCFLGCNDSARKWYPQLKLLAVDKRIDRKNETLQELIVWIDELRQKGSFETIYEQEERYYKVSGKYLFDRNRKRGYNFIFTDYTEEKMRNEEHIRIATKAKSDVLAQMSHEIRTPINAIMGLNEMILRTTSEADFKQYARDVKQATNNLLEIVNEILDFSRIDSGKMELVTMDYNLSNLIRDVVKMFSIRAEEKGLKFLADIDTSLPSGLYGDEVKIRQILSNLLSNAVKYTLKGTVELQVSGIVEDDMVKLHFRVKDTGIGIKPENRDKLFREFERIEEKQNRGIEGTGLGMSITIRLLKMMNAELQVESVYGEGSEFYFDLEQPVAEKESIAEFRERQQKMLKEDVYQKSFMAPEAKILVVDDNKMNLKVFCGLLGETKVQIDQAEGGQECLELAREKKYDIIFLDHMMPEMDGVETLHYLKQRPDSRNKETVVIALTANAVSGSREYYLKEGFDDFMSKPFSPEALERMILCLLPEEYIIIPEESLSEPQAEHKEMVRHEIEGIDWNHGLSHFKNETVFLETMEDFYQVMSLEAEKLKNAYEKLEVCAEGELLKQYRVQVHSMKGSANLIGALELGTLAQTLENAAREENMDYILEKTIEFLAEWEQGRKHLEEIFIDNTQKQELDREVVIDRLEKLGPAFADMDVDQIDEIMEVINSYSYSDDMAGNMEYLNSLAINLDGDNAVPLIVTLVERLKMDAATH